MEGGVIPKHIYRSKLAKKKPVTTNTQYQKRDLTGLLNGLAKIRAEENVGNQNKDKVSSDVDELIECFAKNNIGKVSEKDLSQDPEMDSLIQCFQKSNIGAKTISKARNESKKVVGQRKPTESTWTSSRTKIPTKRFSFQEFTRKKDVANKKKNVVKPKQSNPKIINELTTLSENPRTKIEKELQGIVQNLARVLNKMNSKSKRVSSPPEQDIAVSSKKKKM